MKRLGLNHFRIHVQGPAGSGATVLWTWLTSELERRFRDDHSILVEVLDREVGDAFAREGHIALVTNRAHLLDRATAWRWIRIAILEYQKLLGDFAQAVEVAISIGVSREISDHLKREILAEGESCLTEEPRKRIAAFLDRLIEEGVENVRTAQKKYAFTILVVTFVDAYVYALEKDPPPEMLQRELQDQFAAHRGLSRENVFTGALSTWNRTMLPPWQVQATSEDVDASQKQFADDITTRINELRNDGQLATGWYSIYLALLSHWILSGVVVIAMVVDELLLRGRFEPPRILAAWLLVTLALPIVLWLRVRFRKVERTGPDSYWLSIGGWGASVPNRGLPLNLKSGLISSLFDIRFALALGRFRGIERQVRATLPDVYRIVHWCVRRDTIDRTDDTESWVTTGSRDGRRSFLELSLIGLTVALIALTLWTSWWAMAHA